MTADPPLPPACAAWLAEVDRVMKRDWCIDSVDAGWSSEDVVRYWGYGETPADFVEWFAEKYGLIRFTPAPMRGALRAAPVTVPAPRSGQRRSAK